MARTIVPVMGMHRSGTSAVAGALHVGGVSMGSERHFHPPPLPENPKGFFEDHRFRRINDATLHRNGYEVESWAVPPEILRDSNLLEIRRILLVLRRDLGSAGWGWKDPRTCLTFDLWASMLRRLGWLDAIHAVLVIRDPGAVSNSLFRRNGIPRRRGLDLWDEYNRRALGSLDSWGVTVSVLDFARLLADPVSTMERLSKRLPDLNPTEAARFVDPRYDRSSSDGAAVSKEEVSASHPAFDLFEDLRARGI